jgi:AmmeMemoRadiSam system protein B/AmmeMemoRadiSam system protein A
MKKTAVASSIALLLFLFIALLVTGMRGPVKEPAVAGSFYPADKKVLAATVSAFLAKAAGTRPVGELVALVVPHAGYVYSGQVAAYSYDQLRGRGIDTVILIGSAHTSGFAGASVLTKAAMRTPLGDIPINRKIARSLVNEEALVLDAPGPFEKEHSLEVQLPFLQTVLKDFSIVPVLTGIQTGETFAHLSAKLGEIVRKHKNVLIIASSDLSHYHDAETAVRMDARIIDCMTRMSLEDLEQALSRREGELCGGYAVLMAMAVARNLGATHGTLYRYAHSGDVTGDRSRVVGYAALGIYKAPLTAGERTELLHLAKDAILSSVRSGRAPAYAPKTERLRANGAVFVTINRNGALRGCIGTILPTMPLYRAVQMNAVAAGARDHRFPPIGKDELNELEVEVTVLSPLERVQDVKAIRIGTHGLYLIRGGNAGVLLPQVASEQRWDVPTFLKQLSLKAGLCQDAWKDGELYSFTADVIR